MSFLLSFFIAYITLNKLATTGTITYTTTDNTRTLYTCTNGQECTVNCYGNEVCKEMTIICPTDNTCNVNCQPNPSLSTLDTVRQTQLKACYLATIEASTTPTLNLNCQNQGCVNLTISMNNGGDLTIAEPAAIDSFKGDKSMQYLS